MLHDPGSCSPHLIIRDMRLSPAEKDTLRFLAHDLAVIAALPVHKETAELWRRLNDLEPVRPLFWINEKIHTSPARYNWLSRGCGTPARRVS